MLGLARAGHYTTSWNTGELDWNPELTGSGSFTALWPGETPSYSTNDSNRNVYWNSTSGSTTVDLTGWNTDPEFDIHRLAFSWIIKLPDPGLIGNSQITGGIYTLHNGQEQYGDLQVRNDNNGTHYNVNGGWLFFFDVGYPGSNIELPHSLAGQWLHVFACTQENDAGVFANYGADNQSYAQARMAVYNLSANNQLIGVEDLSFNPWNNNGEFYPIANESFVKVSGYDYPTDNVAFIRQFGPDGASISSGMWFSFGKTFDPANTSIINANVLGKSVASINGVDAWINGIYPANGTPQFNNYTYYSPLGPNNLFSGSFGHEINPEFVNDYWSNLDTPDGGGTI